MLQLADCGLKDLETLQACNRLREGIPLYYCEGEGRRKDCQFGVSPVNYLDSDSEEYL